MHFNKNISLFNLKCYRVLIHLIEICVLKNKLTHKYKAEGIYVGLENLEKVTKQNKLTFVSHFRDF